MRYLFLKIYSLNQLKEIFEDELNFLHALISYAMYWWVRVWTHRTDEICLALRKVSTKFVSSQFSICQAWAYWDTDFGSNLYAPCICPLNTSFSFCIFQLFGCGYTLRSIRRRSLTSTFARLSKLFIKPINSPNTALPPASRTLPLVSLDLCPFFHSRLLLNPQLGCFQLDQSWCNLYMYSADSGGLHMDVDLVGLHRDVQIEQD